jgi:hypothetical protein
MDDQELSYELDGWPVEARELLDRLLTGAEIPHAWQGATVSVPAEHEQAVDELIDEVDLNSDSVLDPEAERFVYEVAEWSPEDRADLADALLEEGVRHEFDEMGDLMIEAIDEDRVDAIIADLSDDEEDDEPGPEANDVLSALFLAADKLRRSPRDARAAGTALESVDEVIRMSPPYGFDRRTWAQIGLRAGALRVQLDTELTDDDGVTTAAEELRELLHPLV